MTSELQALQNFADQFGYKVHQKHYDDKRRTTSKYFIQDGSKTISPVLDYEQLNCFMIGYMACLKNNKN